MRTKMVCCILEGTAEMFKQRLLSTWLAVKWNFCIQDGSIAGFFQVSSNCSDQPQRIIVETASDIQQESRNPMPRTVPDS